MAYYLTEIFSFRMRPSEKEWLYKKSEEEQKHIGEYMREIIKEKMIKEPTVIKERINK